MEKAKQVGSSGTSSSFAMELFGPKEASKSSSTGHFGTIFGPPTSSLGPAGKEGFGSDSIAKRGALTGDKNKSKDGNNYAEMGKVEPCYFNSSIYYGGQEVYSPTNQNNITSPPNNFKKEGGDDDHHHQVDPNNESNSSCASRGNWWQGSLYY